ncbi:hypothetical protein DM02DRAFT_677766 [Periconia macrospinosa]|uniref:Uncharacterized protein n=1 Tax=Periconia macrospinosa TaxID=97972 RepID=A0A2V1D1U5_9PLEO|nr:hypothetical protein DM02DRAFT_677766 [Periconia macrospinosa]
MHSTTFASALAMTATAAALTPEAGKSPEGVVYNSTIVSAAGFDTKGYFGLNVQSGHVILDFKFTGVSRSRGGPFHYRIHENPVSGNDCATAGGIFDPYGDGKSCRTSLDNSEKNKDKVENCAVGDVSGHVDYINVEADHNNNGGFPDVFLSLDPKSRSFVGNRALVISNGKEQRVACGTVQCVKGCDDNSGHGSNGTSNDTPNGFNGTISTNGTVNTPDSPGAPSSGPVASLNSGLRLVAGAGALFTAFATVLL